MEAIIGHRRIGPAGLAGNASLYASGTYPGYVPVVALAATSVCSRIESISMLESVDLGGYAVFAVADKDLDVGFMTIGQGRIAAIRGTIAGDLGLRSRIICRSVWKLGETTTPNWPIEHSYVLDVDGDPSFRCRIEPGKGWTGAKSTGHPIVNSIPAVCSAPPGIVNMGELPFVTAAHTLR